MKERILRALGILFAVALIAGGILTAVIAEEAPTVSIEYFTLSHENAVYIEYAVDYRGFDGVPGNTGMLYWTKEPVKPELGTEDSRSGMLGHDEINGQKYYIFKYANLTAAQMCDDIWACAYATVDGTTYYSNLEKYSVETYAARKLGLVPGVEGTKDETLKDLLRAMLEYGEKAQKHFKDARQDIYPTDILHPVTVTFDADNGTTPTAQTVWRNRKPAKPADPTKDGYTFAGWRNGNTEWNFDTDTVTEDVTLTAHWNVAIRYSEGLSFDSNGDGTCSVSGIGTCTDTELNIPPVALDNERVTGISDDAFRSCGNLTSVTIPDGVTYIGDWAFGGCKSLTNITLPEGLTHIGGNAFSGCSSLTSITFPEGLWFIGDYAFRGCSISSIRIPAGVTSIGTASFWGCGSLASIEVADGNKTFHAAGNCLIETDTKTLLSGSKNSRIPADGSVTSIVDGAFAYCSDLSDLAIPSTVTQIGWDAFLGCDKLIQKENGISYVGKWVVGCDDSATSVTLRDDTVGIAEKAFYNCWGLTQVTIPSGVKNIGGVAFFNCINLIQKEDGVWYVDKWAIGCDESATNINLRNGTVGIADRAFNHRLALTNVTVPSGVTFVGNGAFAYCKMTSITIPNSVTYIGKGAFEKCEDLQCIVLPFVGSTPNGTVNTHFGYIFGADSNTDNANYVPKSLTKVSFRGTAKDFTIDENAFYGLTGVTVVQEFRVEYNYGDGFGNRIQYVSKGSFAPKPADATKDGYRLVGWFHGDREWNFDTDTVTGDVTLTARWTEIPTSKGLKYTSNGDGTCYVSGFGSCKDTNLVIPSYSESGDRVTAIGNYAFGGDSQRFNVTSIVIPEGVTAIGNYAFNDCTALVSVVIPEGVISVGERAFNGCISLVRVAFPDSMVSLGRSAFCYCTSLIELRFGKGLESYGGDILFPENCLESIIVDKDNPYFHSAGNCLIRTESKTLILGCRNSIIPADGSVTIIANEAFEAFYGCKGLTSIVIPECITTIGPDAFYNCDGLTSIIIPNSVQSIGSRAFASCEKLTSIVIPDGVKSIPYEAFYFCTSLKSVKIPDSVTSIGHRAFFGCRNLTELLIPDTVTSIGEQAYNECTGLIQKEGGVWYVGSWVVGCDQSVTTVTLRGQVVGIIDRAFQKCNLLTSITLSDGVAFIGEYVFFGCTSLTSVSLPGSVTHIGSDVFYNCDGLTDITYAGTKSQWKSLDKGWEWDHSDRYKVTIHCTDGDIVKS